GCKYQLLVARPVENVALVGYPNDFIRPAAEQQSITVKGVDYRALPFPFRLAVSRLLRPFMRPGIHPRRLTVVCTGPEGKQRRLEFPVLLRRGWTWLFVAALLVLTL